MKHANASIIDLVPAQKDWRLIRAGEAPREVEGIEGAAAALEHGARVRLSLPTHLILLERMKLPSGEEAELSEMARLQLEKTWPFPMQEVSSGITVIEQEANVTTLLSAAVRNASLEKLCGPLRDRGVKIESITPNVMRVAGSQGAEGVALMIYAEQDDCVLAIARKGKLLWAHAEAMGSAEALLDQLPQILLAAEIEGAPVAFESILISEDCEPLRQGLRAYFSLPVGRLASDRVDAETGINLLPAAWRAGMERDRLGTLWKRRLAQIGAVYLALAIGAFLYLGWMKARVAGIAAKEAAIRPQIEELRTIQERWVAMEPAIDPQRTTAELLYQLCESLPNETVRLTEFDQTVTQWKVFGEVPSVRLAIDYLGKLQGQKALSPFHITASPPALLPNDQAQFSIFGKR